MSVRLQENDMKSLKVYFKVSQREREREGERGRGGREGISAGAGV